MTLFRFLDLFLRHGFMVLVRAYMLLISPWLGTNCRFSPTCSQYAIIALKKKQFLLP